MLDNYLGLFKLLAFKLSLLFIVPLFLRVLFECAVFLVLH